MQYIKNSKRNKRRINAYQVPGYGGTSIFPPQNIALAGSDISAFVNEPILLDGSNSIGSEYTFRIDGRNKIQWDFGYEGWDFEGSLFAPIAYPEAGVYVATLTIYDADDVQHTDTIIITVNAIPLGNVTSLTDTGNAATNRTNLQNAINNVVADINPVIEIPAGFVAAGTITLAHRTSNTYCTIRTANHALIPTGLNRIDPTDAADLFILETTTNASILETLNAPTMPSRYYNIIGAHFRKNPNTLAYTNAFAQMGLGSLPSIDSMPNHIIFDRCYFDGGSTVSNTLRGILLRVNDCAVVNSYFHRFKGVAIETQAILLLMGERVNIMNNFLEAATENFMSGGSDPSISGHVPSYVVFRRNYLKKDLGWLSTDPSYYGTNMSVKNVFEMKIGNIWSVQGNRMENHWIEDQNYSITITVRNQDGSAPWSVIQYVDFSYNKIHKCGNGMSISGTDNLQISQQTNHFLVRHNTWTGVAFFSGQDLMWLLGSHDNVSLIRNSTDLDGDPLGGVGKAIDWDGANGASNFKMLANIVQGFINNSSGKGITALNQAVPDLSYEVVKNGFYRSSGTNPVDNSAVALIANVLYTDLANFDLSLQGGSPFIASGLNGERAGADIAALNLLHANVITGQWDASLVDFVTDSFTEGSNVTLVLHTGEVGATWTRHPGAAYIDTAHLDAAGDRLFNFGNTAYYSSGVPPSANYYVQADFFVHTIIATNIAICGRMDITADTMYLVRLNNGTIWELRKIVAGAATTLGSSTNQLPTVGNFKTVKLIMNGTSISVEINGIVEIGPITDAAIAGVGKAGLRMFGSGSSSTGYHFDNYSARGL